MWNVHLSLFNLLQLPSVASQFLSHQLWTPLLAFQVALENPVLSIHLATILFLPDQRFRQLWAGRQKCWAAQLWPLSFILFTVNAPSSLPLDQQTPQLQREVPSDSSPLHSPVQEVGVANHVSRMFADLVLSPWKVNLSQVILRLKTSDSDLLKRLFILSCYIKPRFGLDLLFLPWPDSLSSCLESTGYPLKLPIHSFLFVYLLLLVKVSLYWLTLIILTGTLGTVILAWKIL